MNKFQKLAQLNRDIELLENAGKIKSAEVLHKKFLKEAQLGISPAFPQVSKRKPQMGKAQLATTPMSNIAPAYDPIFDAQGPQAPTTTGPAQVPYSDPEAAMTNSQVAFQGLGTAMSQPQATSGDNANQMQAQNSNPNAQQESNEQKLYMNSLNDIENAFKQQDRNTGETIYNQTYNQFQNPKRKQFFGNQIQRLRAKYLKPGNNQGPKQM